MRAGLAADILYYPATRLFGERVREHLRDYRQHDYLSRAMIDGMQAKSLAGILEYAKAKLPYYERSWRAGIGPASFYESLSGLPLLEKQIVRDRSSELLALGGRRPFEKKTTSGSTGNPVTIWKDRGALARERAATWRAYAWAGIPVAAPQALLWGRPLTATGRVKATLLDFLANRKRLSVFGVTEERLERFYRETLRFRPTYLYGYVSAVKVFVDFVYTSGRILPSSVEAIVTTSELLDSETRHFLQKTTGLKVFNEYGCGEVGSIAHDCEFGRMHVMADNLVLECIQKEGLPDGLGELVVTDLFNVAMPLIRYKVGDLGSISSQSCECGRPYPILERIVGRAYDLIEDSAGRVFHPEAVLYVFESLRRVGISLPPFQAVQKEAGKLEVFLEDSSSIRGQSAERLTRGLEDAFGSRMNVTLMHVDTLQREPSGKLRVVKRVR